MFKKIYPHDQIEKYLYLDIIFIVLLIYNVIQAETIINLFLKIVLLLLVLLFFTSNCGIEIGAFSSPVYVAAYYLRYLQYSSNHGYFFMVLSSGIY
ncbi:hypothetical protein ABES33_14755 [Bacillus pseudomycoides]|uniref:hypothetical protein n=1 Tax=Bacillus pseudomycoides TaxID=64104 RepID=UPI003D225487